LAGCIDGKALRACTFGGVGLMSVVEGLIVVSMNILLTLHDLVPRLPDLGLLMVCLAVSMSWAAYGLMSWRQRRLSRRPPPAA
jgi:hypothetical protein